MNRCGRWPRHLLPAALCLLLSAGGCPSPQGPPGVIGRPAPAESDERVERLLARLREHHWKARADAATALGELRERRAAEPLVELLGDDRPEVRLAAAVALGGIGDRRAIAPLVDGLKGGRFADPAPAGRVLAELGPDAILELFAALEQGNGLLHQRARQALRAVGPPAVDVLIPLLFAPRWSTRKGAATGLGYLRDRRAVPALIAAVQDPRLDISWAPTWALGQIGDERAMQTLIEKLADEFPATRKDAALGLGNIGSPRATGPLIVALGDPDSWVRWAAATALGKVGDPSAIGALADARKDKAPHVRFAVSRSLKTLQRGGPPAPPRSQAGKPRGP